jgi:uncharacterized protein
MWSRNPQKPETAERSRRPGPGLLAAAAVGLLACAPPGGGTEKARPRTPAAGARMIAPSGAVFALEGAATDEERAQGLMFREFLDPASGMIFLFDAVAIHSFWMKNCHFPQDMVFTLRDGTVVDVLANVPPCASDPCPTYPPKAPADTVVELNAGTAARNGIVPGVRVTYRDVPRR